MLTVFVNCLVFMSLIPIPSTSMSLPSLPHGSCDVIQLHAQNETNVDRTLSGLKRSTSPARGNFPTEHSSSVPSVSRVNHNA